MTRRPTPHEAIKDALRNHSGVSYAEIMGRSRSYPIVAARFAAIAAVRERCGLSGAPMSYERLGRIFERDPASIRNAICRKRRRDPGELLHGARKDIAA